MRYIRAILSVLALAIATSVSADFTILDVNDTSVYSNRRVVKTGGADWGSRFESQGLLNPWGFAITTWLSGVPEASEGIDLCIIDDTTGYIYGAIVEEDFVQCYSVEECGVQLGTKIPIGRGDKVTIMYADYRVRILLNQPNCNDELICLFDVGSGNLYSMFGAQLWDNNEAMIYCTPLGCSTD